jgi:endonuclease/exonuclease/phosphatase family metal-dependent hydrolase
MRVMTWNLWWRFGRSWRERGLVIESTLERHRPDVVGLVETWAAGDTSQPEELGRALGQYAVFARTSLPPEPDPVEDPDHKGAVIGLGLLSRWPVRDTELHELPHDRRGGPPPTALLVTLGHPRGPLHVIVSCLEWEPMFAGDQLAQARVLARLATDRRLDGPLPVLVVGDMNAAVEDPVLAPLTEVLVDTWIAGGGDPGACTLDAGGPHAPLDAVHLIDRRIDHILARPGQRGRELRVRRAFLAGDRPMGGVYPSDHYAVGVDFEL